MNNYEIEKFQKHELMDRLDMLNTIFENTIAEHPIAHLMESRLDKLRKQINKAYQEAGAMCHGYGEEIS